MVVQVWYKYVDNAYMFVSTCIRTYTLNLQDQAFKSWEGPVCLCTINLKLTLLGL